MDQASLFRSYPLILLVAILLSAGSAQAQSLVTAPGAEEVFTVVEDMPIPWLYKTECLEVRSAERHDCYMQHLNTWLAGKLVYPSRAIKNKTTGSVVTRFIIDKSGAIRDVEILKDIGDGCGEAAKKAIEKMPDWVPGRQRGVPVNVAYTIPVKFELK